METLDNLPSMEVPLFGCGAVYLCCDRNKWQQAHEALGATAEMMDHRGAANTFSHTQGGKDIYLLGVFDHSPATLAHETAHIVFDICKKVGVVVTAGASNETFCYLLDCIVEFATPKIGKPTVPESASEVKVSID